VLRLAFFSVLNGVALCMFGLIQFYTSKHNYLYWTYPALGEVFGPFVSRNMFPFYVNCCIGLGLGLLIARRDREVAVKSRRSRSRSKSKSSAKGLLLAFQAQIGQWLLDPPAMWLACALAFMAGTVFFTLSRGGVLALVAGVVIAVAFNRSKTGAASKFLGAALITAVTVALVAVFGMPAVESRLSTLWTPESADAARIPLWKRTLPTAFQFPLSGTGQGTFAFVEFRSRSETPINLGGPLSRDRSVEPLIFEHAHNDYLEVLIESGIPGLLLILLTLMFLLHYGLVASGRPHGGKMKGLALGCMAGLTAVLTHSFVDFGMRAPAIAWTVITISAMLCGLGTRAINRAVQASRRNAEAADGTLAAHEVWEIRFGLLGAACGAAVLALAGAFLCVDQWRAHRVERLQAAATAIRDDQPDQKQSRLPLLQARLPLLQAACRLAPGDAAVNMELAQCYLDIFREDMNRIDAKEGLGVFLDTVSAPVSLICDIGAGMQPALLSPAWLAHWVARQEMVDATQRPLVKDLYYPGMQHCIAARNACPLMPEPQLLLARNASKLASADPATEYYERAKLLAPRLPEVWFFSGLEYMAQKDSAAAPWKDSWFFIDVCIALKKRDAAWSDWQKCLTISPRFLDQILIQSVGSLRNGESPIGLIGPVLPKDRPDLIIATGLRLYGREDLKEKRDAFFKEALKAFERQAADPPTWLALKKAQIEEEFGQHDKAKLTLDKILLLDPWSVDAHFELAKWYFNRGDYGNCERQLVIVMRAEKRPVGADELRMKLPDKKTEK
jgi:O-antigen ligase/tetratricopeptide (TPR) repeat protein